MISLDKIFSVKSYSIANDNSVFFIDTDNNLFRDNTMIIEGELSIRGMESGNLLLLDEKKSISVLLKIPNLEITEKPYSMIVIGETDHDFFGVVRENTVFKFAHFDKTNLELKEISNIDFDIGKWQIFDKLLVILKGKVEIKAIDLNGRSKTWQRSILEIANSSTGKISSQIVDFQNLLFYYFTDNKSLKGNATYVISMSNGEVVQKLPTFTGSIKKSDGLLYTSHEKSLQILDPETFAIREIDLVPELSKHGFKRMDYEKWFVEDKRLYFAQNIGAHNAKIGVFDLESEKMIDSVDLAKENGTIGTLKKRSNRLYVHTQDRTLHIYDLGESPT